MKNMMDIQQSKWNEFSIVLPYPIAAACRRYAEAAPGDPWAEWEMLSRDLLGPVLQYLSHLLLSDLVAAGQRPAHLYHRIQSVLSRPMAGHYAGFLREGARHMRDNHVVSALPELVDFLYRSEVECAVAGRGEALIGKLVDLRNLYAHGRIEDRNVVAGIAAEVRDLTVLLLEQLSFLEHYPLELADGTSLMGAEAKALGGAPQAVRVRAGAGGGLALRPLLLKLKKGDLALLEDHDVRDLRLVYKGSRSYEKLGKKELKAGEGGELLEALLELLRRVRSEEAVLPGYDWESFRERASVVSGRTLSLYEDMHKYIPKLFVSRPEWEGESGIFGRFMASDKTLLAVNGVQGTGKSALAAHLATECLGRGDAVLLVNAQRFTFAEVSWSGNPYGEYFARELRYEKPLDRQALRSLAKGAPDGRRVVLFIDAINEVDGIENKWNRFRAMELLLEWIAQVAQPGVKVVLTFRLEAYERFGYLEAGELPAGLKEICWPGTNPGKPWVVDLEPFDENQAEALYARLQAEADLGMAPAMDWEEVKARLGPKLGEFTSNPLLFTVFLRAHHKEGRLLAADREELFRHYAEKLTGAAEAKKKPWWKRVLGFLRDGNITAKERLLADLVSKMAEEGGAAFLVEKLEPRRSKRDRRLAGFFNDPANPAFADLKEAGLIVEEPIALVKAGKERFSRRITFIGELMVTALDGVGAKIDRIMSFRSKVLGTFAYVAALSLLLLYAFAMLPFLARGQALAAGYVYETEIQLGELFKYRLMLLMPFLFIPLLFIWMNLTADGQKKGPKAFGVFEWSYLSTRKKMQSSSSLFLLAPILLSLIMAVFWVIYRPGGYYILKNNVLWVIAALILTILLLPWIAWKYLEVHVSSSIAVPERLRRKALSELAVVFGENARFPRAIQLRNQSVFLFLVFVIAAFYFLGGGPEPPLSLLSGRLELTEAEKVLVFGLKAWLARIGIAFVAILAILFWILQPLWNKRFSKIFSQISGSFRVTKSKRPLLIGMTAALGFFLASCAFVFLLRSSMRKDLRDEFLEAGFSENGILIEANGDIVFNIDGVKPSESARALVQREKSRIKMLSYGYGWPALELSEYPKLSILNSPAALIKNLEKSNVSILGLSEGSEGMETLRSTVLKSIHIPGTCGKEVVHDIGYRFPRLERININEPTARFLDPKANGFRDGLKLSVRAEPLSSTLDLDWLTPEIGERVVLDLYGHPPVDRFTKNREHIRRLELGVRSNLRAATLEKMVNLESLKLILFWNDMNTVFLAELRELLLGGLPHFKKLEIEIRMGNEKTVSAQGNTAAAELINGILTEAGKGK